MQDLEILSLNGCTIDDSAIPILKTFPKLETLYVDDDVFTKAGIKQLEPIKVPYARGR